MSLAAALRIEQEEKAEFHRTLAAIPDTTFDEHADIVTLKATISAAQQSYYDARAAAPHVNMHELGEGQRALLEEISAKKVALKGLALRALLDGDTGGEQVADAKAALQRLEWRAEALGEGMTEYRAAAQRLHQDVTVAATRLQTARRNLENRLRELRYEKAREEMFGARARDRDVVDRFTPRLQHASMWA